MQASTMKQIISLNLSELRRERGMTQLELAEKLNYSDKAVSKWERGESIPDILVLKSIADLFGVTVDYLISEEHPVPPQGTTDSDALSATIPAEAIPTETVSAEAIPAEVIPSEAIHAEADMALESDDPSTPTIADTEEAEVPENESAPMAVPAQSQPCRKPSSAAARSITAMSMLSIWLVATILFVTLIAVGRTDAVITLPFIIALPLSFVICLVLNSVFNRGRHNHLIISFLMWSTLAAIHLSLRCFSISVWLVYLIGIPGQGIIVLCGVMVRNIMKAKNAHT